jgi:hypothetical protein
VIVPLIDKEIGSTSVAKEHPGCRGKLCHGSAKLYDSRRRLKPLYVKREKCQRFFRTTFQSSEEMKFFI